MSKVMNEFHALWRASANEAVAYSDDFPEALLVLPELIDGALGDGKATDISIGIDLVKGQLVVRDNGVGITSERRLKDWAAKSAASTEHVYGHGSKKCLTKWMPDYETATWVVKWRKQDRRGLSGVLNTVRGPFVGPETDHTEDDVDEETCQPSGTEWTLAFHMDILHGRRTPADLCAAVKEILCTRYEFSAYRPFTIRLNVTDGKTQMTDSSKNWKTLRETLQADPKNIVRTHEGSVDLDGLCMTYELFKISCDGRDTYEAKKQFPLYGAKNIKGSRLHLGLKGRYIEPMPFARFYEKTVHNSANGLIGFVNFTGDGPLPMPCTTKVKFQEDCPVLRKCLAVLREKFLQPELPVKLKLKLKFEPPVLEPKAERLVDMPVMGAVNPREAVNPQKARPPGKSTPVTVEAKQVQVPRKEKQTEPPVPTIPAVATKDMVTLELDRCIHLFGVEKMYDLLKKLST